MSLSPEMTMCAPQGTAHVQESPSESRDATPTATVFTCSSAGRAARVGCTASPSTDGAGISAWEGIRPYHLHRHGGLGAVRLKSESSPDATDCALAQTATAGHRPGAPVGGVLWHRLHGQGQDSFHIGILKQSGDVRCGVRPQARSVVAPGTSTATSQP